MAKKRKFQSTLTYDCKCQSNFEKPTGESEVVEGGSYTIKELMQRHLAGMRDAIEKPAYYEELSTFDTVDHEKILTADPFDQAEMLDEYISRAERVRQAVKDHLAATKNAQHLKNPQRSEESEDGQAAASDVSNQKRSESSSDRAAAAV